MFVIPRNHAADVFLAFAPDRMGVVKSQYPNIVSIMEGQ
jgi:hypothetical protein